ncbi:putative transporter [Beauveria bassiana]|nr:putative transporter [Beauveria bassiana]
MLATLRLSGWRMILTLALHSIATVSSSTRPATLPRFFGAVLGIFESGLFPGIVLYFSSMYTRGELAVRIGVFYKGGSLSGAFRGLLARGLSAIGPRANWKFGA